MKSRRLSARLLTWRLIAQFTGLGGVTAFLLFMIVAAVPADPHAGEILDLNRYEVSFDEPFDSISVSPWGPGTRWIAHTPWNGDFGSARFIDPRKDAPFKVADGILQIEMRRQHGRWQSGMLSSANRKSVGFVQSGGYFEMRAKLPGGPGVWPAFWLGSNAVAGSPSAEIDVIEYYGKFPNSYMATTHIWQRGKPLTGGKAQRVMVPTSSLESEFHTYGVAIDPENVIFYLDRREVARQPTRPEFLQPVYLMVDLGAGGGWPIDGMVDPSIMYVDYVRAYRLRH